MENKIFEGIPLNAPHRKFQNNAFASEILDFVKQGPYLHGEQVFEFEKEFASYIGTRYCIGVSSGTSALELGLLALKLPQGSKILTAANAGGYASIAAHRTGFQCSYYDVNKDGLATVEFLEAARTPEVAVVIITHLYGQAACMVEITEWANHNDIILIEDCAQAAGASLNGIRVGTFGTLATFSFYPTKNLGCLGDAGAICTDDANLAQSLQMRRQYGWKERYNSSELGSNFRMDEIQAIVLRKELPNLDGYNSIRRNIWWRFKTSLAKYGGEGILIGQNDDSFVAHLGVLRVKNRVLVKQFFDNQQIMTGVHYPVPDYRQSTFDLGMNFSLQNTEDLCGSVISIPLFESLSLDEIDKISNVLELLCKSEITKI